MENRYEKSGDVLVVHLGGALNSANSGQVEAEILGQIERGANKVLLNLTSLEYISSAGLRIVLVVTKRLTQSAGRLVLCGIRDSTREVFEITGFDKIMTVEETPEDAMKHFVSRASDGREKTSLPSI